MRDNTTIDWATLSASQLDGQSLGLAVTFPWRWRESGVEAIVFGELRELHHDSEGVWLYVTGLDGTSGKKTEFRLATDISVQLEVRS